MEELEHPLAIVALFNKAFGPPIAALLGLAGIHVKNPRGFIPDYIVMVIIVAAFLIVFLGLAARRRSLVPRGIQTVFELILGSLESLMVDIIGPQGKKYLPMIG